MHIKKAKFQCVDDCFQPAVRRPALFRNKDEYECYTEGYVKCFWAMMCDPQNSVESFTSTPPTNTRIVTQQPRRQVRETPLPLCKNYVVSSVQ